MGKLRAALLLAVASVAWAQYTPSSAQGGTPGNVTGPGSSTSGDLSCYADTTGKVLVDCGAKGAVPISTAVSGTLTSNVLRDHPSVIDSTYAGGADPTGVNDSTAAFTAAANSGTGTIYVPTGIYKIGSQVVFLKKQILMGAGAQSSIINCTNTSAGQCIVFADPNGPGTISNYFPPGGLENLTLNGPGSTTASVAIYLGGDPASVISPAAYYGDNLKFYRLMITNFGTGIYWGQHTWGESFIGNNIIYNGIGVDFESDSQSGEENLFAANNVSNNTTYGFDLHNYGYFNLSGNSIDYNGIGVFVTRANVLISGNYMEQSSGPFVSASGITGGLQAYTATITAVGNGFNLAATTGTDAGMFVSTNQYVQFNVSGGSANTSHAVTNFISAATGTIVSVPSLYPILTTAGSGTIGSYSNLATSLAGSTVSQAIYLQANGHLTIGSTDSGYANSISGTTWFGSAPVFTQGFTSSGTGSLLALKSATASNTDLTGELTFSTATTASYTFVGTYTSHPECHPTPQFNAALQPWVTYTSTTSFTINFATAVTGTVSYSCIGRN